MLGAGKKDLIPWYKAMLKEVKYGWYTLQQGIDVLKHALGDPSRADWSVITPTTRTTNASDAS